MCGVGQLDIVGIGSGAAQAAIETQREAVVNIHSQPVLQNREGGRPTIRGLHWTVDHVYHAVMLDDIS